MGPSSIRFCRHTGTPAKCGWVVSSRFAPRQLLGATLSLVICALVVLTHPAPTLAQSIATQPERHGVAPVNTLRVASWNLRDFSVSGDTPIHRSTQTWQPNEIGGLRRTISDAKVDVWLLQGITDLRAARRLFPAQTHLVVFSKEIAGRLSGLRDPFAASDPNASSHQTQPLNTGLGYTAVAIRRSRALRLRRQEHLRAMEGLTPGTALATSAAATAVEVQVAGRKIWLASLDLSRGCKPAAAKTSQGTNQRSTDSCRHRAHHAAILDAWMALRDENDALYLMAGPMAAMHPGAREAERVAARGATETPNGLDPLWFLLDRSSTSIAGNPSAQQARIEAENVLRPPRTSTGLSAAQAPRVARVKLEPPREPSRAPNAPYEPPGQTPRPLTPEGPDTVAGIISRALTELVSVVIGRDESPAAATVGDAPQQPSQGEKNEPTATLDTSMRETELSQPVTVRSDETTAAAEEKLSQLRAAWPAPWWISRTLRFLALAPTTPSKTSDGRDLDCPDATRNGWTGDALILGAPLQSVATLENKSVPLDTRLPQGLPCPIVLDITFEASE